MKENKEYIQTTGTIIAILGNSTFRVKCENNQIVIARISAEFRKQKKRGISSKIVEGSRIKLKLSLNDLSRGNIIGFVQGN